MSQAWTRALERGGGDHDQLKGLTPSEGMDDIFKTLRVDGMCFGAVLLSAMVLASGCSSGAATPDAAAPDAGLPGKDAPGVTSDCNSEATFIDGPYRYVNNEWGSANASGSFEQCVLKREAAGGSEYGWTWSWPGKQSDVLAYPEAIYGWKPWSGGPSTDPRFPFRVADMRGLTLNFNVELEATGFYDLAAEVWLVQDGEFSAANPGLITAEVMFWLDSSELRPAGAVIAAPSIGGVEYELFQAENFGDRGDGSGWTYLVFRRREAVHQGTLDVLPLLEYLAEQGWVASTDFVAGVEFGTEVSSGSGTLWNQELSVEARP